VIPSGLDTTVFVASVAGRKSDHGNATALANILRTDRAMHRSLLADTEPTPAIGVPARAQQDAVWHRNRIANELRSMLPDLAAWLRMALTTT
jgi:hypothetical protein